MRRSRAPLWSLLAPQASGRGDHGWSAVVDRVDDLTGVDSLQVDRRNPEVCVPELPLDNRQRDPFVRHLDRVRVPQLVRREPPPAPQPARRGVEARRVQRSLTTRAPGSG